MSQVIVQEGKTVAADTRPLGYFETLFSILASVAGVQSWKHFERDVNRGSPLRYVIVLAALMVAFVLLHVLIVDLVLRHSGLQ
jgi:uncharacterized membrane protein YidH (DUF202 family)